MDWSSEGAELNFKIEGQDAEMTVFTTRADTIYGVTFMVLAPESEYVKQITTSEQQLAVDDYLSKVKNRTERERIADRRVSGVFSGSYAINPIAGTKIPIWISDYVLAVTEQELSWLFLHTTRAIMLLQNTSIYL